MVDNVNQLISGFTQPPAAQGQGFDVLADFQRGRTRNALLQIAPELAAGNLERVGQIASTTGNIELIQQVQGLVREGKTRELDFIKQKGQAIRQLGAEADVIRQQNPQNFQPILAARARQFVAEFPEFGFQGENVFATLMDPAQSAAALASVQDIDDIIDRETISATDQAKLEQKSEQFGVTEERRGEELDLSRQRASETERANLAREDGQRAERQAKVKAREEKAATAAEKARIRAEGTAQNTADTRAVVSRLLNHEGLKGAVGLTIGSRLIPGSDAADFRAIAETLKARLGFEELARMRANSPTGGALGQVTERELSFLQAAIQSLAFSQSEEQFIENLNLIDQSLSRLERVQRQGMAQQDEALGGPGEAQQFQEGQVVTQGGVTFIFTNGAFVEQ